LVKQLSECPASGAEQQACLAPDRRVVVVFQGTK
jgi:hypothetical protein